MTPATAPPAQTPPAQSRILVVDDMPTVARAFQRILQGTGYLVDAVSDGSQAVQQLRSVSYDVVLTDISMPGMSGLDLLRAVHAQDSDIPVILITGDPSVETAIPAVEYGALCYLVKPVSAEVLRQKVSWAVQLHQRAAIKRQATEACGQGTSAPQLHQLREQFSSALQRLCMHYQPIICWSEQRVYGYEALVRSKEPALANPAALFSAAEQLGEELTLSKRIREIAPLPMLEAPERGILFFNLHVHDLNDDALLDANSSLCRMASRVVLEVTERASLTQVPGLRSQISQLREFGFAIAVDDLGAGYAGLSSFALLEPDVVKLDMTLIRDIHLFPTKQRVVRSMTQLCADLGLPVVAEGVECQQERDVLIELKCDLLQGYFFAQPAPPFVEVTL